VTSSLAVSEAAAIRVKIMFENQKKKRKNMEINDIFT